MGIGSRVMTAVMAAFLLAPATAMAASLFDGTMPMPGFQMFPFWKNVVADMQVSATPDAGPLTAISYDPVIRQAEPSPACADERHCAPRAWTDFLSGLRGLDAHAQLQAVNRWANARPYVDDMTNWGVPDYWETPGEFIAHGGDCEDFAIAKYFSLVRLGFPEQDLRIVIVSDSRAHDFHAVLVARQGGVAWLLDNQLPDMVPLETMAQYTPVYSLNEEGWWLHAAPVIQVADGMTIAAAPLPTAPVVRLATAR